MTITIREVRRGNEAMTSGIGLLRRQLDWDLVSQYLESWSITRIRSRSMFINWEQSPISMKRCCNISRQSMLKDASLIHSSLSKGDCSMPIGNKNNSNEFNSNFKSKRREKPLQPITKLKTAVMKSTNFPLRELRRESTITYSTTTMNSSKANNNLWTMKVRRLIIKQCNSQPTTTIRIFLSRSKTLLIIPSFLKR